MAPTYNPMVSEPKSPDDIERIVDQFGKPIASTPQPPTHEGDGAVLIDMVIPEQKIKLKAIKT